MPSPHFVRSLVRPLRLAGSELCAVGLLGGLAGIAQADPLTVSSATTTAVSTSAAANGSAGDITVDSSGSIIVSDAGPAVTIDSSNALSNSGTIQSSADSDAVAVRVDGSDGITTTIVNDGTIGITGSDGSGNYGIRIVKGSVSGSISSGTSSTISVVGDSSFGLSLEAPFTGDIALTAVSVSGDASTAVSITAPMTGKLTLSGASYAYGADATGLLVAAPVNGAIVNSGTMTVGQPATTTTDSDGNSVAVAAAPGIAAFHVAADVTGGLLNDRYYVDSDGERVADADATSSDTLVTASIAGIDGTTGLLVAPLSGSGADIRVKTVGTVGTDDGYGIVNRGSITGAGTVAGFSATAMKISGDGDTGARTVVEQGFINQEHGSVSATATGSSTAATATGIEIGANASVPTIVNQGTIGATTTLVSGTDAGTSRAIVIDAGGEVGSIVNSGTIGATTTGGNGGAAVAILDASGTVGRIDNSGTIFASGTTATAIDLSAGSQAVTITNSGGITGDIRFGSGDSTYRSDSGELEGAIAFGSGDNRLSLGGTTSFTSALTLADGGSLAVELGDSSSLNLGISAPTLASLSASGQSQLVVPLSTATGGITVTGAASFTDQSSIRLVVTEQPGAAPITIVSAGGGITTDHLSTLIGASSLPYLYTLSDYGISGNDLTVTLHQKTGLEAGFVPGVAALFDQSLVAFGNGASFQAIANLTDQASLFGAYRQITPPGFGTLPIRLAQSLHAAGTGVVRGRLDALALSPPGEDPDSGRLMPWIQEGANLLRKSDAADDPGFRSDNFALSFGADYPLSSSLAVGAAATFQWDDVHIDGMKAVSNKPFSVTSKMIDLYAGWHGGPFFVQIVGAYGWSRYDFQRQIDFADVSVAQSARWSGSQVSADLVGGLRLHAGRFTIEPSNSLSYVRLRQKGYTMTGGGDLDLAVDGRSDEALLDTARLSLAYGLPLGEESSLGFTLRGGYAAQLAKDVTPMTASFLAGGSSFDLASAGLRGGSVQAGAGISYRTTGFYVGLNGDRREEGDFTDTAFTLTARIAF
ncbi:autotransporter outer membrane beta-barrel domain-containing protein [Sphingomonas sp. YL-JM2C]